MAKTPQEIEADKAALVAEEKSRDAAKAASIPGATLGVGGPPVSGSAGVQISTTDLLDGLPKNPVPSGSDQFDYLPQRRLDNAMAEGHIRDGKIAPPLVTREEEERLRVAEVQRSHFDENGQPRVDIHHSSKIVTAYARREMIDKELAKITGHPNEVARLRELIRGL